MHQSEVGRGAFHRNEVLPTPEAIREVRARRLRETFATLARDENNAVMPTQSLDDVVFVPVR